MPNLVLVIGNKAYSSWSLRPWLLMKQAGIAFDEIQLSLYQEGARQAPATFRSGQDAGPEGRRPDGLGFAGELRIPRREAS